MTSKPTIKEIEEWQANLIALAEKGANGMTKEDYNVISKPKHYMLFEDKGIEVRDVIEKLVDKCYADGLATQGCSLFISDYVQLMQYLMRFMDKNGVEDLKKARWYLDKMIESY
jgi:anti-sigma regulatory factor (Ser/Thr protein kinase)